MSGIEALAWAQAYPDEVESIIGLDMAVPHIYESLPINLPALKAAHAAGSIGLVRMIPGVDKGDATKHGTLTDREKDVARAVFHSRLVTTTMVNEAISIKASAIVVGERAVPPIPMLLFLSNGEGTGYDQSTWRSFPHTYLADSPGAAFVDLDVPHYAHDYAYQEMSVRIRDFLDATR
jgi:hypothetical protein